jgi:rfaE bifunctional protein nucleotidyltransferase chain/domain
MKICQNVTDLNQAIAAAPQKKIVFTNGVFDVIHPGHVEVLEFAKSCGDILIVALNSDSSVQRLKGVKRPIFSLAERMQLVAEIKCVDYVIAFNEDTPLALIKKIKGIDVLVKGGDYQPDQIVGRDFVEENGGLVVSFPFKTVISTSEILKLIGNQNN